MIPLFIMSLEDQQERDFMMQLYLELKPYMHQRAFAILKDYNLAEDMVHDTFMKLIPKISELIGMSKNQLASYVAHTVINTSLNYYNRHLSNKSKEILIEDDDIYESSNLGVTIEEKIEIDESKEAFGKLLEMLSEQDRTLIYCKYYLEMSDQDIAATYGLKQNNVRVYISRARQRLKKLMKEKGYRFI